jgi:hypothetical protein
MVGETFEIKAAALTAYAMLMMPRRGYSEKEEVNVESTTIRRLCGTLNPSHR